VELESQRPVGRERSIAVSGRALSFCQHKLLYFRAEFSGAFDFGVNTVAHGTVPRSHRLNFLPNVRELETVSTGAIVAIAIAAAGILMMRFRKRWLAKINIVFTNRITGIFAGWLPGFGILWHVGRKSGKVYRTPINVFRVPNGFIIALTYSSQSEWVKNVLAAGRCELKTVGKNYRLSAPKVVHDTSRRRFPVPVRLVLMLVGADEFMELSASQF
jgi:deazaflavin-dependent oxidoreductase (nitroreductase family)